MAGSESPIIYLGKFKAAVEDYYRLEKTEESDSFHENAAKSLSLSGGTACAQDGGGPASFRLQHDEELYIDGQTVVWSGGQQVRKRYSLAAPVTAARWGLLAQAEPVVAVLLASNVLHIFHLSGVTHAVPLESSVASVWQLPVGFLLEGSGGVWSLLHPQEEPQAVDALTRSESIIWSSAGAPLVVTYNHGEHKHSLWRVLYPPHEDKHEAAASTAAAGRRLEVHLVWRQPEPCPSRAEQVVLADAHGHGAVAGLDAGPGSRLVGLLLPQQPQQQQCPHLASVLWDGGGGARMLPSPIPALSVAALSSPLAPTSWSSGRQPREQARRLLLLSPLGHLTLYAAQRAIWTCPAVLPVRGGAGAEVVRLCDAVGDRVTLVTADAQMHRCRVKVVAETALVQQCLQAVRAGGCVDDSVCRPLETAALAAPSSEAEWAAVARLLRGWALALESPPEGALSGVDVLMEEADVAPDEDRQTVAKGAAREDGSRAWETLLSARWRNGRASISKRAGLLRGKEEGVEEVQLRKVLLALHAVFQDLRLDVSRHRDLAEVGEEALSVAAALGEGNLVDHYARLLPHLCRPSHLRRLQASVRRIRQRRPEFRPTAAPDLMRRLLMLSAGTPTPQEQQQQEEEGEAEEALPWSRTLLELFSILREQRPG
eukprot:jgi/Mesen1/4825/ME000243S04008